MYLAIECGATKSVAVLVDDGDLIQQEIRFGSANYKLMQEEQLTQFLVDINAAFIDYPVHSLGIGIPGILDDLDVKAVENIIRKLWPHLNRLWVGNDLETALACVDRKFALRIIIIAGTGSCSYGINSESGYTLKIGGYGHVIGDRGSGFAIAEKALRLALRQHEYNCSLICSSNLPGIGSDLLKAIMKQLGKSSINQLINWTLSANKTEIAALTTLVVHKWKEGDSVAKQAVEEAIDDLSADCVCLIRKLQDHSDSLTRNKDVSVGVGFTGSLLTNDQNISDAVKKNICSQISGTIEIMILKNTVLGALKMIGNESFQTSNTTLNPIESETDLAERILPIRLGLSLTERRNEKSMNLDSMNVVDAIDLMISEESSIYSEINKQKQAIAVLIEKVCTAFKNGGRLFYVGAGTSGRLGILDASECPPTFRSPPEWVQGIIAGGFSSVQVAKEGAEDSIKDGMQAIDDKNVSSSDVVVGIAASGGTPFVWGSIFRAKSLQAFTALITFNTCMKLKVEPDVYIAMNLGPEVLTGSTRLKSGSATKCVLNILSTLAMVKYGKCFENLMVDLNPANQKLRERALRITLLMTADTANISEARALEVLKKNKYDIKLSVNELRNS